MASTFGWRGRCRRPRASPRLSGARSRRSSTTRAGTPASRSCWSSRRARGASASPSATTAPESNRRSQSACSTPARGAPASPATAPDLACRSPAAWPGRVAATSPADPGPAGASCSSFRPSAGRQSCSRQVVAAPSAAMSSTTRAPSGLRLGRKMLNKVPEVTLFFWVIKIMCTTVGETAADYLNVNLGFGLTKTTYVSGALLVVLLAIQFRLRRYVPVVYWSAVVVISVFGTLITDNMTDRYNVPLTTSTTIFAVILAIVFAVWYWFERTLSIHTIFTIRREAFYWLAILFTFALGTAAGDLVAEKFDLGYGISIAIFGGVIALITIAHYGLKMNAVLSFWLAYIMTRPLGASIGDFMSQNSKKYGGLGLGTTGTSYIFLGCILALVIYLSVTRRDATEARRTVTEAA